MRKGLVWGLFCLALLGAQWAVGAQVPSEVKFGNRSYEYVFETSHGLYLADVYNRITGDHVARRVTNPQIAAIEYNDKFFSLDMLTVNEVTRGKDGIEFVLSNEFVECRMKITKDKSAESLWQLSVKNLATQPAVIKVTFPLFAGLVAGGDAKNTVFFHGLNGGTFARSPVYVRGLSGYSFPLLDVYNKDAGGLYMIVRDTTQILKGFDAIKVENGAAPPVIDNNRVTWEVPEVRPNGIFTFKDGCGMAVTFRQAELAAGQTYVTPEVAVGTHIGRWEKAWESYASWLNSVATMRPLPDWFRQILFSKPLFEDQFRPADQYVFDRYIRPFDGKYSMFVMGHWTDTRGDYNVRPKWGGPEPFRQALADLRKHGIHSTLYLEAVNVGPDAKIAQEHWADWTVIMNGKPGREGGGGQLSRMVHVSGQARGPTTLPRRLPVWSSRPIAT